MAKKEKRDIPFILFLSLILHIIFFTIIITFAFKKLNYQKHKVILPPKAKNETPASLKAKRSNFGTTVLFDDTPQFKPALQANINAEKQAQEIKHSPKNEPKNTIPKKEINTNKKLPLAKINEQKEEEINKTIEVKKRTISKDKTCKKNIPRTQIIKNVGLAKQNKTPKVKTKSILSMTKGFVENLEDKGEHWITREGDDNKTPDINDLKHASYMQKIIWQFQQELKIKNKQMDLAEKKRIYKPVKLDPIIFISIDQNGNLNQAILAYSSGLTDLDDFLVKTFKEASPYPPIPKHLNLTKYECRIRLINK